MKDIHHTHIVRYLEISIAFVVSMIVSVLLLSLWAKLFVGDWNKIQFLQEIAPAISLAVSVVLLFIVRRYLQQSRGRTLLSAGFLSFVIVWFMIIPIEKYAFVFPQHMDFRVIYILFPLVFTGNIFLVIAGLQRILSKRV